MNRRRPMVSLLIDSAQMDGPKPEALGQEREDFTLKIFRQSTLLMIFLALFVVTCLKPVQAETSGIPAEPLLNDMFSQGVGYPPFRMEVSVKNVHGPNTAGTNDLLKNCLLEDLRALGSVEFVGAPRRDEPPATLRLRVWFTQRLNPAENECFDTTVVVIVGKILERDPRYEAVLDTYTLSGVALRDWEGMCNKITMRFDLKILSVLKKMCESSNGR